MLLITQGLANTIGIIENLDKKPKGHFKNKKAVEKIEKLDGTYILSREKKVRYVPKDEKIIEVLIEKYQNKLYELNEYGVNSCSLYIHVVECPSDLCQMNFDYQESNYNRYMELFQGENLKFITKQKNDKSEKTLVYNSVYMCVDLQLVKIDLEKECITFWDIDETYYANVCEELLKQNVE